MAMVNELEKMGDLKKPEQKRKANHIQSLVAREQPISKQLLIMMQPIKMERRPNLSERNPNGIVP